jgi:large subunit GTPase 1
MKEYTGPVALVVKRIMKEVLEATYGLSIQTRSIDEGGDGILKAGDLLSTYAGQYSLFFGWLNSNNQFH